MKKLMTLAASALLLAACGSTKDSTPPTLDTATAINTYLEGKAWKMAGADIPSHPNGFNEDVNYGAYTQCYADTTITVGSGVWHVVSHTATLAGTPTACDHVSAATATFDSSTVLVENVAGNGTCFDVTVTYTGFSQAGRAAFSADGRTLQMELFFGSQATHHRCADGLPGATGVVLNGAAFTGTAVQTYRLQ